VTGSVARIGDELAQGRIASALGAAALVLAFYSGATFATVLVDRARSQKRARYAAALSVEAAMLLVVTLIGGSRWNGLPWVQTATTALLCTAMGAQNALVTKLSGAVVRTTHLTGTVTDLAIETVRVVSWLRRVSAGRSPWRRALHVLRASRHPELQRVRLHLGIVGSFLSGAVIGPWIYLHHGHLSMLFPVALLAGLVTFDSVLGFRSHRQVFAKPSVAGATGPGPRLAA
jgi:uncharacterized membrane protein YoaK (UPF0700 family)